MTDTDWTEWSREAKRLMQDRTDAWQGEWQVNDGTPYRWTLDPPELVFERSRDLLVAHVTVVGTRSQSEGTFLWAWANEAMPDAALADLDQVRAFGAKHELTLVIDAEWPGGHAESLEALMIAARLLDAKGVFVDDTGDVTIYFAIRSFEIRVGESTDRRSADA